ncbi:TaqI-like C-terminal specificity domain-containing protein [Phocaeicola coprophilus]
MDDFLQPKLIYPETTQGAFFAYDETGIFLDKTCFMMITKYARYIQATLSSQLFEFAYKRIFSSIELGQHGFQYNKHALIKLPIKRFNEDDSTIFSEEFFYNQYGITKGEIDYIQNAI